MPPLGFGHELGLAIHPNAPVLFAPGVGSYVGGDITAGLLRTVLASATDEVSLFLDIGTNGEVVVGNGDWLLACAASAGPAFEGSGIRCGMRADAGAIERVRIDAKSGRPVPAPHGYDEVSVGPGTAAIVARGRFCRIRPLRWSDAK